MGLTRGLVDNKHRQLSIWLLSRKCIEVVAACPGIEHTITGGPWGPPHRRSALPIGWRAALRGTPTYLVTIQTEKYNSSRNHQLHRKSQVQCWTERSKCASHQAKEDSKILVPCTGHNNYCSQVILAQIKTWNTTARAVLHTNPIRNCCH